MKTEKKPTQTQTQTQNTKREQTLKPPHRNNYIAIQVKYTISYIPKYLCYISRHRVKKKTTTTNSSKTYKKKHTKTHFIGKGKRNKKFTHNVFNTIRASNK